MSTIKANTVTASTTNGDMLLEGNGSGVANIGDAGFKVAGTAGVPMAALRTTSGTASSSTFLRGDGQWQAAGGGAWTLLSNTSGAGDATITATNLDSGTYTTQVVILSNVIPSNNGIYMYMQWGPSGGLYTADYNGVTHGFSSNEINYLQIQGTGQAQVRLNKTFQPNPDGSGYYGIFYMSADPAGNSGHRCMGSYVGARDEEYEMEGGQILWGRHNDLSSGEARTDEINQIKIWPSAGTWDHWQLTIYGISES